MATIALEGMQFYAYHGFYREERKIGADYLVDVYITTMVTKAAVSDDLGDTVNYETVYQICESAMRSPSNLIEKVAELIAIGIRYQFSYVRELQVRVRKMHPPLGGHVKCAFVEVDGEYSKKCGRCSRPMLCYGDKTCWCMSKKVYQKTLDQIKGEYGNQCLCEECLQFFAV